MEDIYEEVGLELELQNKILELSLQLDDLKQVVKNKDAMLIMLQENILKNTTKSRKVYKKNIITSAKRLYFNDIKDTEDVLKNLKDIGYDKCFHEPKIIKQFTDLKFNLLPNNLKEHYIKRVTCLS